MAQKTNQSFGQDKRGKKQTTHLWRGSFGKKEAQKGKKCIY